VANADSVALLKVLATNMETHDFLMTQFSLDYNKIVCMRNFIRGMGDMLRELNPFGSL
jgi:hypothetical protein